jgi:hypothetical protein
VIDVLPPVLPNRKCQMANTELHGMREFSFLQVLDSQQVKWFVKGLCVKTHFNIFMLLI